MASSDGLFEKGHKNSPNFYTAMAKKRGTTRPAFSAEWRANISRAHAGKPSHMKGKHFSEQARANMRAAQQRRLLGKRGSDTPRWIHDRTKLRIDRLQMYDSNYKAWMLAVKNRDGWKCRIGDAKCSGRLEAHHILSWHSFPELRYQINNGITLCHHHHPRSRAREVEMVPAFQELVATAQ